MQVEQGGAVGEQNVGKGRADVHARGPLEGHGNPGRVAGQSREGAQAVARAGEDDGGGLAVGVGGGEVEQA